MIGTLMPHSMYCIVYTGRPGVVRPSALGMTCAMVHSAREKRRSAVASTPNITASSRVGKNRLWRWGTKACVSWAPIYVAMRLSTSWPSMATKAAAEMTW